MSVRTNRVLRFLLGPRVSGEDFETLSFVVGSVWLNAILTWRSGRHSLTDTYRLCENGARLACAGLPGLDVSPTTSQPRDAVSRRPA